MVLDKSPDELFEEMFMKKYRLGYKDGYKKNMKKCKKTAIRRLYGKIERNAKGHVLRYVRETLGKNPSVTAPGNDYKDGKKYYRRDQETFFIGEKGNDGCNFYLWKQVR
jgi:hypothetical protein